MEEIWKQSFLAPEYEVSSYGRIRWYDSKKWVSTCSLQGYLAVNRLTKYTDEPYPVKIYIHRLVAYEFVEGYKEDYVVNHIDGCKTNNFANNLEWVDRVSNISDKYNPQRKYDQAFIDELYDGYRSGLTTKALGNKYNIAQCYISRLLLNNLHSKDLEAIKYLYNNNIYSSNELAVIYNVKLAVINKVLNL